MNSTAAAPSVADWARAVLAAAPAHAECTIHDWCTGHRLAPGEDASQEAHYSKSATSRVTSSIPEDESLEISVSRFADPSTGKLSVSIDFEGSIYLEREDDLADTSAAGTEAFVQRIADALAREITKLVK